mmetsp:Transcript_13800/g.51697  ORF Transcript_13800/g.51697 Transcript_13800/m.51697 type:complete len:273 (+) Transcript_13800:1828-2646(+)
MQSACLAHCAHQGLGNGSAFKSTTSFALSSCASQCAVASWARGPTPAWPTSANLEALSATRAWHDLTSAANVAAQNSSSASAAPSETGTTATVRGACCAVSRSIPVGVRIVPNMPAPADPLFATPGTPLSTPKPKPSPPSTATRAFAVGVALAEAPALAPMRHASAANALGALVASASNPAAGIHRSCVSLTALALPKAAAVARESSRSAREPPPPPPPSPKPSFPNASRKITSSPTASPGPRNRGGCCALANSSSQALWPLPPPLPSTGSC